MGNLAVCELKRLQFRLICQLGIPLFDEGNKLLAQLQKALGSKHVLRCRDLVGLKFAVLIFTIEGAEHDGGVRLPKLLIDATLAADGKCLRLISAGNIVRVLHSARAPLQPAVGVGNVAAAILPLGVLFGKLVADVLQVTLALDF